MRVIKFEVHIYIHVDCEV